MGETQLPGAYLPETIELVPESIMSFNAAGDLVKEQLLTASGAKYERDIFDSSVADRDVAQTVTVTRWRRI